MSRNEDREFEDLLNIMVDGELTNEQSKKLESYINSSAENRQFYQDFCQLQAAMESISESSSRELLSSTFKAHGSPFSKTIFALAALLAVSFTIFFMSDSQTQELSVERGERVAQIKRNIFADFEYGGKDGVILKDGSEIHSGVLFEEWSVN